MTREVDHRVEGEELLRKHRLHNGLYARVAKRLRLDVSYVSRVASGKRKNDTILKAVVDELRRIDK